MQQYSNSHLNHVYPEHTILEVLPQAKLDQPKMNKILRFSKDKTLQKKSKKLHKYSLRSAMIFWKLEGEVDMQLLRVRVIFLSDLDFFNGAINF